MGDKKIYSHIFKFSITFVTERKSSFALLLNNLTNLSEKYVIKCKIKDKKMTHFFISIFANKSQPVHRKESQFKIYTYFLKLKIGRQREYFVHFLSQEKSTPNLLRNISSRLSPFISRRPVQRASLREHSMTNLIQEHSRKQSTLCLKSLERVVPLINSSIYSFFLRVRAFRE